MRRLGWIRGGWIRLRRPSTVETPARPAARRDRLAVQLACVTLAGLGLVFVLSHGTLFLMPGPLASAHGGIEKCSACHSQSGSGKLSWMRGLAAGDPHADSKACLTCHKMPDTAFNAHGASAGVLSRSTERLTKIAAVTPQPRSARAQSVAFPAHDVVAGGLTCATCHQEHQGVNFKLGKISNEQCRSCHVVKFDSFDGAHPKFESYPFKKRTQIVYDHAGHFDKHFPEVAKKDAAKRIPATCSTCHNSSDDKRVMAVAPFDKTCATCHLDQITGKTRVSGPKGIAFLTLPGLDVQSLKKKNAAMGEWPDASEAALSPFMKVMISRTERGRAVLKTVESLNLQDLAAARDDQITAVAGLVWEIKALFHAMILGKTTDVLGNLNISGAKLSADLVTDLTASIPRDVLISAQQQWLPNLATEMANQKVPGDQEHSGWTPVTPDPNVAVPASPASPSADAPQDSAEKIEPAQSPDAPAGTEASEAAASDSSPAADSDATKVTKRDPPPCMVRVFGQCMMFKGQDDAAKEAKPGEAAGLTEPGDPKPAKVKETSAAGDLPPAMRAGLNDLAKLAQAEGAAGDSQSKPANGTPNVRPDGGKDAPPPGAQPQGKVAGQAQDSSDDLLFPTEAELREMKVLLKDGVKSAVPDAAAGTSEPAGAPAEAAAGAAARPAASAAPVISIGSDVDPESWAESGGWYRQDFAIYYRPSGHKDKFVYSWLFLTGPQAPKNDPSPAAAVFDFLTSKDAQGSCTKCHSVDDLQGKGRVVNFAPPSVKSKQGRFTNFIHEPHLSTMDDRGCLTCHALEKSKPEAAAEKTEAANFTPDDAVSADAAAKTNAAGSAAAPAASTDSEKAVSPYLKSYEQGNPQSFASNFGDVKKDLCQTCHTSSKARQDCLTCHTYHVNGVITPIMSTKVPTQ